MPAYWFPNSFFDSTKTKGLYEAMECRESCRSFASGPSAEQWEALRAGAEAFAMPGTRLVLGVCENALFSPFFGLLMKFENVSCFAAVLTRDDNPESVVSAGAGGELFMLEAVRQGLMGCWVSGTFKRGETGLSLEPGEKIRAVIALGVPKARPALPLTRKRKPLDALCSPNFPEAPPVFREMAKAVRIAPSAINLQPWRLAYVPEDTLELSVRRRSQRLDLGIALSHAVLAAGNTEVTCALLEDGLTARLTL